MKINRSLNEKRNVLFGIALKLYQILLPFAFRSVIVYALGVQYLGLNSLFTSVLQVLNLAELGIGSAMVFSMYRPIVDDDNPKICALIRLYKTYYNIIGLVILVVGLCLTPYIPTLIKGTVPDNINIYLLYILNLVATVLTYWLFAYRNSILQAYQRQDISSKVTIATDTVKYVLQFIMLMVFHNYYLYVIVILFTQALNNIVTAMISKKMYPQYSPTGTLDPAEKKSINNRIKDLFTSKLGGVIVNSTDTIVISSFLGLEILAIYQNYYYIISSIMAFIAIINSSVLAGIGNGLIIQSEEENYGEFSRFFFIQIWIFGFCVCCFFVLMQPFMMLWMGDKLLLDFLYVILFCVYFIGYEYVMFMSVYKDAAGIWHDDRFRPLLSGIINVFLNLYLVNIMGLYGVILSTILSLYLVSAPWITVNVFKNIFPRENLWQFLRRTICYIGVIVISVGVVYLVTYLLSDNNLLFFIIKGIICIIVPNAVYWVFYHRLQEYKSAKVYLAAMIKKG